MKVLIVKMSSMGDVIHCLPAVTDLVSFMPEVEIDWVVEEGFVDIPNLHEKVKQVLPIAIRRWRQSPWQSRGEFKAFKHQLQATQYDLIIDAQGLIKSALVSKLANGPVLGFDRESAREPLASSFYHHVQRVSKQLHAVDRIRQLLSQHFGYKIDATARYELQSAKKIDTKLICLFHGTTWQSKHWPDDYWLELASLLESKGYDLAIPYFGAEEEARAHMIAQQVSNAAVLPPGTLADLAATLSQSAGAVAVDTGLGHLAVAFGIPLVGLYGPTQPDLTGFKGERQISLADDRLSCAPCLKSQCQFKQGEHSSNIYPPCFTTLTPQVVLDNLVKQINKA